MSRGRSQTVPTSTYRDAGCYVCGSDQLADVSDPRNPLCGDHLVARQHKVQMSSENGMSRACCSCGWERRETWAMRKHQDAFVEAHWRDVCRRAAT